MRGEEVLEDVEVALRAKALAAMAALQQGIAHTEQKLAKCLQVLANVQADVQEYRREQLQAIQEAYKRELQQLTEMYEAQVRRLESRTQQQVTQLQAAADSALRQAAKLLLQELQPAQSPRQIAAAPQPVSVASLLEEVADTELSLAAMAAGEQPRRAGQLLLTQAHGAAAAAGSTSRDRHTTSSGSRRGSVLDDVPLNGNDRGHSAVQQQQQAAKAEAQDGSWTPGAGDTALLDQGPAFLQHAEQPNAGQRTPGSSHLCAEAAAQEQVAGTGCAWRSAPASAACNGGHHQVSVGAAGAAGWQQRVDDGHRTPTSERRYDGAARSTFGTPHVYAALLASAQSCEDGLRCAAPSRGSSGAGGQARRRSSASGSSSSSGGGGGSAHEHWRHQQPWQQQLPPLLEPCPPAAPRQQQQQQRGRVLPLRSTSVPAAECVLREARSSRQQLQQGWQAALGRAGAAAVGSAAGHASATAAAAPRANAHLTASTRVRSLVSPLSSSDDDDEEEDGGRPRGGSHGAGSQPPRSASMGASSSSSWQHGAEALRWHSVRQCGRAAPQPSGGGGAVGGGGASAKLGSFRLGHQGAVRRPPSSSLLDLLE